MTTYALEKLILRLLDAKERWARNEQLDDDLTDDEIEEILVSLQKRYGSRFDRIMKKLS